MTTMFFLLLERSWLSFYLSLRYDCCSLTPFPCFCFPPCYLPSVLPLGTASLKQPPHPPNYITPRLVPFRQDATEMRCNKRGRQRNRTFLEERFIPRLSLALCFRALHCTCEGRPPAAERSSSPGIMSHNVMLRSDWHGERH